MPIRPQRLAALALATALTLTACGGATTTDTEAGTADTIPATSVPTGGPAAEVKIEQVAKVDTPTALAYRPGSDDMFVAQQSGEVRRISAKPNGVYELDPRPVLDIGDLVRDEGERGLLGLAFSPDGRTLFVHYSDSEGNTVVDRFRVGDTTIDRSSRTEVFTTTQPLANHNGGQLSFGPDGYLYLGLGDGGGSGDPEANGQNPATVLGSIIRIDPDGAGAGERYSIPPDNPFASPTDASAPQGAPEVWAWGLRNPWRFSFDRNTGDLWVADVGERTLEEINLLPATSGRAGRGVNLGWPLWEGDQPFEGGDPSTGPGGNGLTAPVFTYSHDDDSCSVIGGFVYRGRAIPALEGTYIFGDWCNPALRTLTVADGAVVAAGQLGPRINRLSAFGEDQQGELWAVSHEGGVYRIVPA